MVIEIWAELNYQGEAHGGGIALNGDPVLATRGDWVGMNIRHELVLLVMYCSILECQSVKRYSISAPTF